MATLGTTQFQTQSGGPYSTFFNALPDPAAFSGSGSSGVSQSPAPLHRTSTLAHATIINGQQSTVTSSPHKRKAQFEASAKTALGKSAKNDTVTSPRSSNKSHAKEVGDVAAELAFLSDDESSENASVTDQTGEAPQLNQRIMKAFAAAAAASDAPEASAAKELDADLSPRSPLGAATAAARFSPPPRTTVDPYRELVFEMVNPNEKVFSVVILGQTCWVRRIDNDTAGCNQKVYEFLAGSVVEENRIPTFNLNGQLLPLNSLILKVPKSLTEIPRTDSFYSANHDTPRQHFAKMCHDVMIGYRHTEAAIKKFPELNIRLPQTYVKPLDKVNASGLLDEKGAFNAGYTLVEKMDKPISPAGWSNTDSIETIFARSARDKQVLEFAKAVFDKTANQANQHEILGDFRLRNLMWKGKEIYCIDPTEVEDSLVEVPGQVRDFAYGNQKVAYWLIKDFPSQVHAMMLERFDTFKANYRGTLKEGEFPPAFEFAKQESAKAVVADVGSTATAAAGTGFQTPPSGPVQTAADVNVTPLKLSPPRTPVRATGVSRRMFERVIRLGSFNSLLPDS